ncbi:MAG TPA: SPOR domain-containing protein, partial [Ignavibacteriaceae bacterium]|nr:SPOR domain-containing protein [Ignavibacteriaceae bacterium]
SPVIEDNHGDYKYTIQAGAFSKDSNAAALKKQFEDSGYHSFVKKKTVGGSEFIVVFVGEFKQREEADDFLQLVNKQFKLNGRIVPMIQ